MLWFNGSIKNAVDKVKSSGAFLLVFVQGNDSLSEKYEACLNEKAVHRQDDYVAIKISYDSQALKQFKQIYVSVPVPSVHLIQNDGIPLKVLSSSDTSNIHSAINETINKQKLKQEKKQKMYLNNKSLFIKANTTDEKPSEETKTNTKETSAELSHVKNIGHKLFNISEDELKTRMKEIQAFPKFLLIDSLKSYDLPSTAARRTKTQSARIQFRLPNNKLPSWEFPEMSTLGDVKAYLMEKMKLSKNFKLHRTYPRYSFTQEDEKKTLADLSLTPNAILIVVPYEDKTVQAKVTDLLVHQNFLSTLLDVLLKPLLGLYGYFKKYILKNRPDDKISEKFSSVRSFERRNFERTNKKNLTPGSNIHGFKFDEDTDTDTEHPDNGNSTQQRYQ